MKIEGSYTLPVPRDLAWQHLLDPQALARALPGCEKFEPDPADGSYRAELRVGIAQIKGTYHGRIEILEPVPPERYKLKIDGKGTGGFLKGEGTLALAESGAGTVVNYSGEVQVGGLIASVGQRLLLLAAKQIVNQFFEAFSKQLTTAPPGPAPAGPSSQS